jgi:RNA polymerase sigma-70 factor (ECF subfamily)
LEQPVDDLDTWEAEYQQTLLHWAAERVQKDVQASTWQAFWRTAVEGARPEEVADALGLSVGAVYIAKSRVIKRIRELIDSLENA